ncbi:MAG TPA: Na+/H+ antiporter subunit E [Methylomirabilota bacterium]
MSSGTIVTTGVLVLVYLAALGSAGPGDLVIGVALALLVQWSVRPHAPVSRAPAPELLTRLLWLLPFVAVVAGRAVAGAVGFLPVLIRPALLSRAELIEIPYGERTPTGVAVTALCVSLTPGSIVIEMDEKRRVLIVQAVDWRNADAIRADQARFYQRWQRRVVP